MTYSLDDNWENGPMIRRAGTPAFGLYTLCGLWIARHLTDGHIPADVAAEKGTKEWAAKLVQAGLWEVAEDGFHDPWYLLRNPSAEKVRQRQKAEAERKARWRQANARKPASTASSVPVGQDAGQTAGVPPGVPPEVRATPPTPKGVRGGGRPRASPPATARTTNCPDHRGQPAHNCAICRSERLAADT